MDKREQLAQLEKAAELGGGEARLERQHQAGKLTARERIELLFDPGTFEETRQAGGAPVPRLRDGRPGDPWRRRRVRLRPRRRARGLRLRAGLHGVRRVALRDQRRQDREDHGPGHAPGRAGRRPQRLGRRAHPGRRGRRWPATPTSSCATRWRRASSRRSRRSWGRARAAPSTRRRSPTSRDGGGHELHVRDRAGRHQDRHARGRVEGGSGRRDDAQREERRRALRRRPTTASACC